MERFIEATNISTSQKQKFSIVANPATHSDDDAVKHFQKTHAKTHKDAKILTEAPAQQGSTTPTANNTAE